MLVLQPGFDWNKRISPYSENFWDDSVWYRYTETWEDMLVTLVLNHKISGWETVQLCEHVVGWR